MRRFILISLLSVALLPVVFSSAQNPINDAVISPAQITADQNNYSPPSLPFAAVLRLTSNASRNITGLATGRYGRTLMIFNVGAQDIVLVDESASSTSTNRFALNANITLQADEGALLYYDSTSSRWRIAQN